MLIVVVVVVLSFLGTKRYVERQAKNKAKVKDTGKPKNCGPMPRVGPGIELMCDEKEGVWVQVSGPTEAPPEPTATTHGGQPDFLSKIVGQS